MGFKVKWTPDLEQDLVSITTKESFVYSKEITQKIIKKYGSVNNFKKSEEFKKIKN